MIPEELRAFLSERAKIAFGGTRNEALVPRIHLAVGWVIDDDRATLRCLIPEAYLTGLLSALQDNGQFSLTAVDPASHETYQFKGDFVGSRPCSDDEIAACAARSDRVAAFMSAAKGYPEEAFRAYLPPPSLAVSVRVREVFLQTPGPSAGKRVYPEEA